MNEIAVELLGFAMSAFTSHWFWKNELEKYIIPSQGWICE